MERQANCSIRSEETKTFRKMREEMQEFWNLHQYDSVLSIDYLLSNAGRGEEKRFHELFQKHVRTWKKLPMYRYLITYLVDFYYLDAFEEEDEELKEQTIRELEALQNGTETEISSDADEFLLRIADLILESLELQNPSEDILDRYNAEYIKDNLIQFGEQFFLEFLAPVLKQDDLFNVIDVEIFLTRVLQRDGLDYYNAKEFLLYLVMSHEVDAPFETYHILFETYQNLSVKGKKKLRSDQNTAYIKMYAQQLLETDRILNVKKEILPQTMEVLLWHKSLTDPSERSVQKEFKNLLDQVVKLYALETQDYQRILNSGKKSLKEQRQNCCTMLTVSYDRNLVLPAGTQFEGMQNVFETAQTFVLKKPEKTWLEVNVRSLTEKVKEMGKLNDKIPANAQLELIDYEVEKRCGIEQIKVWDAADARIKKDKSKPKFVKHGGKENGYLVVCCDFGCTIPKGTLFQYRYGDFVFSYEVIADTKAEDFPETEIEVSLLRDSDPVYKKEGKYYVLEEKNAIDLSQPLEGIQKVTNGNRVTCELSMIQDAGKKEEEGIELQITYRPDCDIVLPRGILFYNKHKDVKCNTYKLMHEVTLKRQKTIQSTVEVVSLTKGEVKANEKVFLASGIMLYPKEEIPGLLYAQVGKKDSPYRFDPGKGKKNKQIEMIGKPGCFIPEGTIFSCSDEWGSYEIQTVKDCKLDHVTAKVEVLCEGTSQTRTIVSRRSNTKEVVYADKGTINYMEQPADGILEITNPRAVTEKMEEKKDELQSLKELTEYLFGVEDALMLQRELKEVELPMDAEMLKGLDVDWFLQLKFDETVVEAFADMDKSRKRSLLLTLLFLQFVKENEQQFSDENPSALLGEFMIQAERVLVDKCRMQELYERNPVDSFFMTILFVHYGWDVFRMLQKFVMLYQTGEDRK